MLIQYGMAGLGTVVVPSDIAHPFHHGHEYGGPRTGNFRWIPVVRSTGRPIYQEVFATYRHYTVPHTEAIPTVVKIIKEEVARLGLEQNPDR